MLELESVNFIVLYFDIENSVYKCVYMYVHRGKFINVVSLGVVGGMVLHKGEIAEMRTGEGKTLVAILPAYLNALVGKGVHVVTVNDYLARRDCEWVGQVPRFLGMKVGLIQRMSHTSFLPFHLCFWILFIYAFKSMFIHCYSFGCLYLNLLSCFFVICRFFYFSIKANASLT